MKEACGVFAVFAPGRAVAQLTFDGLYSLQHRGQESAGMAVSDGELITVVKDMGLVSSVFDERTIECLPGDLAIGHTRYSTAGESTWRNAQPVFRSVGEIGIALGHNGTLTNTSDLAEENGMLPGVLTTDSDLVVELLSTAIGKMLSGSNDGANTFAGMKSEALVGAQVAGNSSGKPSPAGLLVDNGQPRDRHGMMEAAMLEVLPKLEGAYSFVAMDESHVFGARDPHGFRPLCLGALPADEGREVGYVLASETPALDVVGARFIREIEPGEIVVIDESGVRSIRLPVDTGQEPHLCIFEFVYFARPDSMLYGTEVHSARRRMGEYLAAELPIRADMVMGVPDSGVPAAEGYSKASGIPYGQGLVKNRYIGRTFIAPRQEARVAGVKRKLNPLRESILGKRLVVVDDSIVRGTTTKAMVKMLRDGGAEEIHLRISSPPFRWPCYFGIDTPDKSELLAANMSVAEIADYLGVDSLAYLSLEGLQKAIGVPGGGFCTACLTGEYPISVEGIALQRSASLYKPGVPMVDSVGSV